jgi:SAM-dependent methyltransferase
MNLRRYIFFLAGRLYLWACHRLYNEFAWFYDAASWIVSGGRWPGWRRLALDYVAGARVLEVGFGTGELLIEAAGRGLKVCGLEVSPAMQRITVRKMRRRGVWAPRICGRVQMLPFAEGCFDTVISTFPAEYIVDPLALQEIARVLRAPADGAPGGRLVVVGLAVYRAALPGGARCALVAPPDGAVNHFEQVAARAGFGVAVSSRIIPSARVPVIVAERLV